MSKFGEQGYSSLLGAFRKKIELLKPSEIAEAQRVLSTGNFPGKFSFELSPWARYIIDCLMPSNPYRTIALMKGSQIGYTIAVLANILLAIFKQYQSDVLFMSDDEQGLKRAMTGFIDDMIRESGIGGEIGKVKGHTSRKPSTGDTIKEKKFNNGRNTLYTWSGQIVGKLNNISPKYSLNDEVDRYVHIDKKGGDPYTLIMQRHKTYPTDAKAFFGSTPELEEISTIYKLYKMGDMNRYHIPCPHCGVYIVLEWSVKLEGKDTAGIYYKRDNLGGFNPREVGYVCQECGGYFKESHKFQMYKEDTLSHKNGNGPICLWKPTNPNPIIGHGSFHISSLYAGAGLHSWANIVKLWCDANPMGSKPIKEKLQTVINQEFGMPFKDYSTKLNAKNLMKNTRFYEIGIIPDLLSEADGNGRIIMLTLTADLNGKMGETPEEDDVRLDWEVLAWCERGNENYVNSYSIMHGSIGTFERSKDRRKRMERGDLREYDKYTYRHNAENSVWPILDEIRTQIFKTESGNEMKIALVGVDSGNYTIYTEEYANSCNNVILLKGATEDKYTSFVQKGKNYDKGSKNKLYLVKGNQLKDILAEKMELSWNPNSPNKQPEGFMNFPNPEEGMYGYKSYFSQFENEERKIKVNSIGEPTGYRWAKKHTTAEQHFFDVRLYGMAVREIMCNEYCKNSGVDISWANFCKLIKIKTKNKGVKNAGI